jgi:hypothetical protein
MSNIDILISDVADEAQRYRHAATTAPDEDTALACHEHAYAREQLVERLRERAERVAEVLA